ncbi:MAG: class I SAM-dependent methyltransferase [Proteobacteria bacterium]|nr:class I SAM-dependent methyltransferase [Pseudomonadota bacterium]
MPPEADQKAKSHWDGVYERRASDSVSWYEPVPAHSLEFIAEARIPTTAPLIDIGAGASRLVDHLLDLGYLDLTVMDVSEKALEVVRRRLGDRHGSVSFLRQDVTSFRPARQYALWHDRAVFHFLTHPAARNRYVDALTEATAPGGSVVMATFGPDGPPRCSNLAVSRYDAASLAAELGDAFQVVRSIITTHVTPGGANQQFLYALFTRR